MLDGTGSPDVPADLAIERGRIAAIGPLEGAEARERLDLAGLTVCPGFIDAHCHSDALPFADNPHYVGQSIAELSELLGASELDAFCHVLLEENGNPTVVVRLMAEPDIQAILQHPLTMIGSDAIVSTGRPHPRLWGTYPRVLGHYARDLGLFSQPEAVRKMTAFPAQKFKLWDRGLLRPGLAADLVVFDPATVHDRATYEEPEQPPVGLPHVLVNGVFAVRDGVYTGVRAGQEARQRSRAPE